MIEHLNKKRESEFSKGARFARDCIISMLIGFQNGMGHNNPNDPEYKAYQRVYETIVKNYGDEFEKFK